MLAKVREELERILDEHQRESGLHMIGGRDKLVRRLLMLFDDVLRLGVEPPPPLRTEPPPVDERD